MKFKNLKIKEFADIINNENKEIECKDILVNDVRDNLLKFFKDGYELGQPSYINKLNEIFTWRKGFLYCFSGYPQSGKSEFINYAMLLRAKNYGDKIVMYSPETDTDELIINLVRSYLDKNVNPEFPNICTEDEFNEGLDFINNHFIFLENVKELQTLNSIRSKFEKLNKKGYNCFIIDPLNWLQNTDESFDFNLFSFLKSSLSELKVFAKQSNSIVCYIEHPKTPVINNKTGRPPKASPYLIAGGTMHFNKVDCMCVLHRLTKEDLEEKLSKSELLSRQLENIDNNTNFVEFETVKMKSQRLNGKLGSQLLEYDFITGRFK